MTLITPGTFLKSVSVEAAFFEVAMFLQMLENNGGYNTDNVNNIAITINADTKTASITATVPLFFDIDPNGVTITHVKPYLASPGDVPISIAPR